MLILDRYILKNFLQTYVFAIAALCAIFMVVNLFENLDDFIDRNVQTGIIIKFYIYFLPEIVKLLSPVAILIATLFSVGRLSNLNEITAMKTGGLSLYRLMMPILLLSIGLSWGQMYFNGWIVPTANGRKLTIEQKYLHQKKTGGPIHNLYFRDAPNRNVIMQYYDGALKSGNRIAIEEFSSEGSPRLVRRIEAGRISWNSTDKKWVLKRGIEREYKNNKTSVRFFDSLLFELNLSHNQIVQIKRSTKEMNYDELREYISILKRGGKDVRKQMIEYYGDYALAFANLIVVLFGIPFASVKKKGGIAVQIGAAMGITFVYLVFTKVSQAIGISTNINPIIIAWSANILFFLFGVVTIIRTKT